VRIRLAVTVHITRDRDPDPEPDRPAIYDVSGAQVERATQWDHDDRPPIGFRPREDRP